MSKKKSKSKYKIKQRYGFLALFLLIVVGLFLNNKIDYLLSNKTLNNTKQTIVQELIPTDTPTPTPNEPLKQANPSPQDNQAWGVAKQTSAEGWSIKLGNDSRMGTAQEIYIALNNYRQAHGSPALSWDNKLATYAQSQADYFNSIGKADAHVRFRQYLQNGAHEQLGFTGLGENSSSGHRLLGVHIIEWLYAGDQPHDENQLRKEYTHVGIGVSGTATDLIFGGGKYK